MTKYDFLYELRQGLKDFSEKEIMEHIVYYREMIEDRIEDGISEEDALKEIGTPEEVVARIYAETPLPKLVKTKLRKERYIKPLHLVLLIVGSPVWLSLLIALTGIIFSLIVSVFSVIISLYAAVVSIGVCGLCGVIATIPVFISQNTLSGLAVLGLGLIAIGCSIFAFMGCSAITKLFAKGIKNFILWIKSLFITKEDAE